ncbi:response regulator transcription factor [Oceanobacter mangrovi]|uniref:response regulator transcription factor n=1 Tax=Oceanobacter mangrovi TaxID=2862510 RepID=UPI001C8D4870|nr:response regulator transcription factor [Oceanobacter mangrovi]
MKILLADDHAVVRQGYQALLQALIADVELVEAASGTDAVLLFIQQRPDVVVLDINMPDMSGIEACKQICGLDPQARILMFSMYQEPAMVREALAAGASGYLSKSSSPQLMVTAVQQVYAGEQFIDPDMASRLNLGGRVSQMPLEATGVLAALPAREREIADRLLEGKTNQVIADELGISPKTVANRATVIRQKFGVGSTAEMVRKLLG